MSFTPFTRLPPEIRNEIWTAACLVSRLVDLWHVPIPVYGMTHDIVAGIEKLPFLTYSQCPVPAILHTSKEARNVGLEHYSLSFGTESEIMYKRAKIIVNAPPRIFFNWRRDIMFPVPVDRRSDPYYFNFFQGLGEQTKDKRFTRVALRTSDVDIADTIFEDIPVDEVWLYSDLYLGDLDVRQAVKFEWLDLEGDLTEKQIVEWRRCHALADMSTLDYLPELLAERKTELIGNILAYTPQTYAPSVRLCEIRPISE